MIDGGVQRSLGAVTPWLSPGPAWAWRSASAVWAARRWLGLGLVASSLVACGGQSVVVVTVVRPARPVWCPTVFHAQTSRMSASNTRLTGSFDTRQLLGQSEASAVMAARKHGCSLRVVNQGGALTTDGRPDRIDVDINHRIVTATGVG